MTYRDKNSNLMIHLSEKYCNEEGIQINFAKMQQTVVMDLSDKLHISGSPIYKMPDGDIIPYNEEPIWILYQNGIRSY